MGVIVAIDDEEDILSIYKEIGENLSNHTVMTFNDGKDAIKYLEKNKCDVIITDYRMAKMNGVKIYEKFKTMNNNPNTVFMFISAYMDEVKLEIGEPAGVIFKNKPISVSKLLDLLSSFNLGK